MNARIARVETFHLVAPLDRPYGPAPVTMREREVVIVKVTTDDGLVGWGEAMPVAGARAVIERELVPRLIGESALDARRLWHLLWGPNFGHSFAVSGLDLALHDLRGKALGRSIGQLYGGAFRTRVMAYAAGVNYEEGRAPEEYWVDEALRLVERGFRAIKFRIGRYPPARELPLLEKVRAAVPSETTLLADGNAAYTLPTAVRVGRALEGLGFGWFEEPIPQGDYAGYPQLADQLDLPLAAGEVLQSRSAAAEFLNRRAADIVQPDVVICGGIGEWLFIAELARLARIICLPHCFGGGILLAASAHVLSLLPDPTSVAGAELPLLEVEVPGSVFQRELLVEPVVAVGGYVDVPTGPGLGVEIDEDVLRHYAR